MVILRNWVSIMSPQNGYGFCYPQIAQIRTARPLAGTKKDKETTENTEHAEKQIDFFREFRAFRSCQKLIVVERLSGNVFQLFAVSSTEKLH